MNERLLDSVSRVLLSSPLCLCQHGEALQHASGVEAEILRVLPGEGEEGAPSQPHDEDDGSGGKAVQ